MRIGAVIMIVGAHDAPNAASRPTVPVPDGRRRTRILAWRQRWHDECQRHRCRGAVGPDAAWCSRRSSRHRAAARTPQAVQLACTRRCLPQSQRDSVRPGPLPAADAGPAGRRLASARPPILRRSVPAGRQSAAAEDAATDPTYQRKTPCPNQPHPVRIRALPLSGRAHPLTAPPHPSRRSRRCHRRLRRRTRALSGPRSACSAGRCRRCARCCAEPPAMRSPGRRAGGQRPSWLAVRHPACPRSRDRRRRGALRGS